jgi:hypothetical protein
VRKSTTRVDALSMEFSAIVSGVPAPIASCHNTVPVTDNLSNMKLFHQLALLPLFLAALCPLPLLSQPADQPEKVAIHFNAQQWHVDNSGETPDVQFLTKEGFPGGVAALKRGSIAPNGFTFTDGTIEFDMKPIGEDMPGIQFRTQAPAEAKNAEEFYIRTSADCRASDDCVQYAPVIHGFMLWNFYPQYQTQAFVLEGWNHVRLVVSGRRMNVYLNYQPQPALSVGELEGESKSGGIELSGPAYFANFFVAPGQTEGLNPQPLPDPSAHDRNIVRKWQLGSLTTWNRGAVKYAEHPGSSGPWKPVTAERFGIVNLNREFTVSREGPKLTWMRTTVSSDHDQPKHVSLAWIGQAWVFVNGQFVTSGKNFYYPEGERRNPDGRLSFENGSFDIPLRKGENQIMIAFLTNVHDDPARPNHYGWGLGMRFDDTAGVKLGS